MVEFCMTGPAFQNDKRSLLNGLLCQFRRVIRSEWGYIQFHSRPYLSIIDEEIVDMNSWKETAGHEGGVVCELQVLIHTSDSDRSAFFVVCSLLRFKSP